MSTPGAAPEACAEEFFPSKLRRLQPAIEELRVEADRRQTLMARRIMSEVSRLPYYTSRTAIGQDAEKELTFWLSLVEFDENGIDPAAQSQSSATPSPFGRSQLPEHVAVQRAVARVADILQSLDKHSDLSLRHTQVTRVRAASWVVLHRWRIEAGKLWYLRMLDRPIDMTALERAIDMPRHDWIAEAVQDLRRPSRHGAKDKH